MRSDTPSCFVSFALLSALVACGPSNDDEGSATSGEDITMSTTRTQLLANNTSASPLFTDQYTPARRFNGATIGVVSNGDAPSPKTQAASMHVGAVSKIPIRSLLHSGSTTKIFVETQSWFCTYSRNPLSSALDTDQCGSHIDIGYGTNYSGQVARQVADMESRGIDGVFMDWMGQGAGKGVTNAFSTSSAAIDTGAIFLFKAAAEASGGKFQFAVLEDEGVKACAATSGCNVTSQLLSDLSFIATNFYSSPAYLHENGRPVLLFFSVDAWVAKYGKSIDWSYVRAHAAGDPIFLFENSGGFSHAASNGAYSWLKTTPYSSYPGSDPHGTSTFLPDFYAQAAQHGTETWGSAYKGFDDYVVDGWGSGRRYDGQVCGKTWLDTFAVANAHYSSQKQLHGLQLVTWDDYEEGTELETGIENHVAVSSAISGTKLSWHVGLASGAPTECAQAVSGGWNVASTIHHFAVYGSQDGENMALVANDLPSSTRTFDVTGKLPSGTWSLYVYALGQPSIRNHLSPAVKTTL